MRVARDPNRIRRQRRTGVARKLHNGEAAPAVSGGSHEDSRLRACLSFAPPPRAKAVKAIPASATMLGRKRSGASRGRAFAPTEAPRDCDLLRRGGPNPSGNRAAVATPMCPAAALVSTVRRLNKSGRSFIEGGDRRALAPACWGWQLTRAVAQGFRGNPETTCQACAGAQRTPNAFRVVSAGTVVATPPSPIPCGRTVVSSLQLQSAGMASAFTSRPPGGAGDRRERASARRNRDLATPGLRRSAASMLVRRGRGNMPKAPRVHNGIGRFQRSHARLGSGRRRDPSGSSRCIARSALHLT